MIFSYVRQYDIFTPGTKLFYLSIFIILLFLSIGIGFWLNIKNVVSIVILFSIISIFLYAMEILDFFYATLGFLISIICLYFIVGGINNNNN